MDYANGTHRGFAFVEYEDADDAEEAIFNIHGAELLGRTLKVSLAQQNQVNKLSSKNEAVWKSSDTWFQENVGGTDEKSLKDQTEREKDAQALQDE
jgi:peptidyl-prolyl isomerase E (cyclophilin E)